MKLVTNTEPKVFTKVDKFMLDRRCTMFVYASIDKLPGGYPYWSIIGGIHLGEGGSMDAKPTRYGRIDGMIAVAFPELDRVLRVNMLPFNPKNDEHREIQTKLALPIRRFVEHATD